MMRTLLKGAGEWLDQTVNPWGPNIVENKGSRSIYVISSDSSHAIQEIRPGRAAQGKIDGVVDVTGRVVCKKDESAKLIFNESNQFILSDGLVQSLKTPLKRIGIGDPLPYGLYYGRELGDSLQFVHGTKGVVGKAMKSWYLDALRVRNGGNDAEKNL